jgi:hypothetical protein
VDDELGRLATLVLDQMGEDVDVLAQHRPHDARQALHMWGLLCWRGSDRGKYMGLVADWNLAVALNDRQLAEVVRTARAPLR